MERDDHNRARIHNSHSHATQWNTFETVAIQKTKQNKPKKCEMSVDEYYIVA